MAVVRFTSSGGVPQRPDDLSNHRHRQLIGYIGLVLPFVLIALVQWRDGQDVWKALDSVSAYYYTGAVTAFAGMLVVLALFLFTYRGYGNESHGADRACAIVAGVAALSVALFPTSAPDGIPALPWVKPWVVRLHYVSAVVLFGTFAVFCLWLFRKKAKGETPDRDKQARNTIYLICGVVILLCILWASYNGRIGQSIFWPESVALVFFAWSWLVKGYAARSAMNVARSLLLPKAPIEDDEETSKR